MDMTVGGAVRLSGPSWRAGGGSGESIPGEGSGNRGADATLATVRAAGVEVPWAERAGVDPDATPVVLLPGFGWRASGCVRSGWFPGGRRVLGLDWPRRWPRRRLATMRELAAVAAAALEELGIRRAHVGGVSTGGMLALQLAIDRPDLVATLALVSSAASGRRVAGVWRLPASRAIPRLLPPERFFEAYRRWGPRLVGTAFAPAGQAARLWTDPMGRRKAADLLDALARFEARDALAAVGAPALVVHGRADAILPWPAAEELARGLPVAHLAVVEGGTHFIFLTHRERVVRELQRLWTEETR